MPAEESDRGLLAAAAAGDADAFGVLFERHARAVYNFCFRRTGDWAAAEDLTSVVFLEAWRRRDVALEGDSARPWLFGVAVNVLRNANRSLRRHREALARVPAPPEEPDPADDVAGRIDDQRRIREVLRVVGRLPRHEREVLQLCAWDGLSYDDAAAVLGVPVGTIRSRLSRARRRLGELADGTGHEQDERRALARAALTGLEGTR